MPSGARLLAVTLCCCTASGCIYTVQRAIRSSAPAAIGSCCMVWRTHGRRLVARLCVCGQVRAHASRNCSSSLAIMHLPLSYLLETLVDLCAGSFVQANYSAFQAALSVIKRHVKPGARVLELHAGVGSIGLSLFSDSSAPPASERGASAPRPTGTLVPEQHRPASLRWVGTNELRRVGTCLRQCPL